MVLLVSGKTSLEAISLTIFPEDVKLMGPVKIFLNNWLNAGTCDAACEQPTTSIRDLETGAL